jgi:glycosyltransferase involved in cell wall biosynthesis|tara:strand:- start:223 stop:1356 length:1134 start_codon:yes stop_codon:yes gene_type:complete
MNILQLAFHTSPFSIVGKNDGGGMSVYVQQISKYLSENHNVTVVTGEKADSFTDKNLEFISLDIFESELNVEDKEIYLQEFKNKLVDSLDLNSFDVIHAHYWLSGLVAKEISNELNIPFIFTSHSLGIFLDGYNKERVDCEKIVMTSTNLVTASSVFETMLIADTYKIDENKIKKITPGVDRKIFIPDLSVEKENIILSIGRIQEQKGQLQTIEFLNNFKKIQNDFKCYFVGGPSGKHGNEYLHELKQTIKDFNLDKHVEFLGDLPQTEIIELFKKAKLLIHTSKFETFGLVAIEANTMGVPVLTTNNGSLMEIIENNKNGYLSENLIDSNVNNFVNNLFNNVTKYEEIHLSCIEKSKKYDWMKTANELESLYQQLV